MTQKIAPYCDFITLDMSHPSSELSMLVVDASTMVPIIKAVQEAIHIAAPIQTPPLLVKIPLDINQKEVALVANALMDGGANGVIIAGPLSLSKNTTIQLPNRKEEHMGMLTGGLVREQVVNLIRQMYEKTKGKLPIIGCGGVFTAQDAFDQICAGASLIQIDNAALTFEGPTCVSEIHKELLELLKEKNISNISEAIGMSVTNVSSAQNQSPSEPLPSTEPVPPTQS